MPVGIDPQPRANGADFLRQFEQLATAFLDWVHEEQAEGEHDPHGPGPDDAMLKDEISPGMRPDGTVATDAAPDRRLAQDPLTAKGEKILNSMRDKYGEKKGESVFYASKNAGKISGVDQDAEDAVVYHGTRAGALQSIIDNGLQAHPSMHYHPDRFYQGDRGNSVYVATDPIEAARWALSEVVDPGDATVLEIEVPQDSLEPDEEWEKAERHVGDIPPSAIMKAFLVNGDGSLGPSVNLNRRPVNPGYTRWVGVTHPADDDPVVFGNPAGQMGIGDDDAPDDVAEDDDDAFDMFDRAFDAAFAQDKAPIERGLAFDWKFCVQLAEAGNSGPMAFDRGSLREYSEDGHLHVLSSRIAQARIDGYKGKEIPGADQLGLDPERIYQLLRDPAELGRPETVASFKGKPILRDHLPISADEHATNLVVGSVGSDVVWRPPFIESSLNFWPREAIDEIESGRKKALSPAYHYTCDLTPGVWNGQRYDGVMRNIRFNHLAQVAEGRQGDDIVVADAAIGSGDAWEVIARALLVE
jgi:hypothetical protein